jgi:hypothetical protein
MWTRHERLIRLYEEQRMITVFDRLDDYSTEPKSIDKDACRLRKGRRSQILTQIARLEAKRPWFDENYARAGVVILLLILASPAV